MILVLPGALPPAAAAAEIARRLPETSPTLAHWLSLAAAEVRELPLAEYACTPLQAWLLERAGYVPPDGAPLGAGWSVIEAGAASSHDAGQPIWLADLAHLHVSQQGVTLLDPAALRLTDEDAGRLIEIAQPLLSEVGIAARLVGPARLRVVLPAGVAPYAPTPQAATGREVQTWWSLDPASRPWRRVLNLVQMAWHDDPANAARAQAGLPPVNSLWLFGGGRAADFASPERMTQADGPPPTAPVIDARLEAPAAAGDWLRWLQELARLDQERLAPLAARLQARGARPLRLVLTGESRLATLDISPVQGWRRLLRPRRHDWHAWYTAR
ncbi:hypothetical protein FOZ76_04765 [Verticiella sediminum]|uniref:Phosphoglycerate mutase n=1 Tax=Verticiella sediminum TaxID=1247510 RepID=A0A556AYT5_9BURK|nr:hypothetical protein [Verticiella sediminum]TSH98100.1 hypothetical protein FOZ76_04765 [Verticiella sediminum]